MKTKNERLTHPVWEFYDYFRTARYRVKAYGRKVYYLEKTDFYLNISLALFTPSSALAGILLENDIGEIVWKSLITIASVIAVIKPFLRIEKNLNKFNKSLSICNSIFNRLDDLRIQIVEDRGYNNKHKRKFAEIRDYYQESSNLISLLNLSKATQYKLYNQVNKEYPYSNFFVPDDL